MMQEPPATGPEPENICARCQTANLPTARFCYNCGLPLSAPSALIQERRYVSVIFADLSGFTELSSRLDAEDLRVLQEAYFERVRDAIAGMGGIVEKFIGDAAVGIFGAPEAHEDDAERAIKAALQIRINVADLCVACHIGIDAQLEAHIGINSGEVVGGRNPVDGTYTVTGDTVNLAARLQQNAQPGEILVGESTYRASYQNIDYAPSPVKLMIRGKNEPILAWQVLGLRLQSQSNHNEPTQTPFIGRMNELDALQNFYRHTSTPIYGPDGNPVFRLPALAVITGEAGIGKSRLAGEFVATLKTIAEQSATTAGRPAGETNLSLATMGQVATTVVQPDIVKGRCLPYGSGITYWPLAEIVKRDCSIEYDDTIETARAKLLGTITRLCQLAGKAGLATPPAERLAFQIGYTIGINLPEPASQVRIESQISGSLPSPQSQPLNINIHAAWRTYFQLRAASRPLVVLLEDMHWAEDSLLDLLEYVLASAVPLLSDLERSGWQSPQRIMWVALARPDFTERRPAWLSGPPGFKGSILSLQLQTLDQSQTRLLVDTLLPNTLQPAERARTTERIVRRSEGIPFFAEELAKMLSEDDDTSCLDQELPETIQAVLAARIDRLPADEKRVLRAAAVFGRFFWPGAVVHVSDELSISTVITALDRLTERDLITRRPSDAILPISDSQITGPATSYGFRHSLIRDVAYAGLPRQLRSQQHAKIATWLEETAGERQAEYLELLAYHYEQAALLTRPGTGPIQREHLGRRALYFLGLTGDRLRNRQAYAAANEYYQRAIHVLQEVEPAFTATAEHPEHLKQVAPHPLSSRFTQLLLAYGAVLEVLGDTATAIKQVETARELARVRADLANEATANSQLCVLYRNATNFELASNAGRAALRLYSELKDKEGQAHALQNLGVLSYYVYQFQPALQYLRSALTLYGEIANLYGQAACLRFIGEILYDRAGAGDVEQAGRVLNEALEFYTRLGDKRGEAAVLQNLGLGYYIQGEIDEASTLFQRALILTLEMGDRRGEAISHRALAWIEQVSGNYDDALYESQIAFELSKGMGDRRGEIAALINKAKIWLDMRDYGAAETILDEVEQLRSTFQGRIFWTAVDLYICRVRLALARGELEAALDLARGALDSIAQDDNYARALSMRMLGIVESRIGAREEREGLAAEASDYFQHAGDALRESLQLFSRAGDRIELGRTYLAYAQHLRRSGQSDEAITYDLRAIEIFRAANLRGELDRIDLEE